MIFKQELAEKVMRGEKTATRRRMSSNQRSPWWEHGCSYTVGQTFAVSPGRGKTRVGNARVTAVYKQQLWVMCEDDAVKEGFRPSGSGTALFNFDAAWCEINGSYDPAEFVWVVEFEAVA